MYAFKLQQKNVFIIFNNTALKNNFVILFFYCTFILINYTYKMQMPITTSLSQSLLLEMEMYAKETGKKKNQVIEESLTQFLLNEKKKRFAKSFQRAALDNEIVGMAEEGLIDYKRQLKKLKI
jgi:hypothetical protein